MKQSRKKSGKGSKQTPPEDIEHSRSFFFQVQTTQLLADLSLSQIELVAVRNGVEKLGEVLCSIPARKLSSVESASMIRQCGPTLSSDVLLVESVQPHLAASLVPPSRVSHHGALTYGCLLSSRLSKGSNEPARVEAEVALHMPPSLMRRGDLADLRYHARRFLYLCYLREFLSKSHKEYPTRWTTLNDCHVRPALVIDLNLGEVGKRKLVVSVTVLPHVDIKSFRLSNVDRLLPSACNITPIPPAKEAPTPLYNGSILHDVYIHEMNEYVKQRIHTLGENGVSALILVMIWFRSRQRSWTMTAEGKGDESEGGSTLATLLLAHLVDTAVIDSTMSLFHIFRAVVRYLADVSLPQPITLISSLSPPLQASEPTRLPLQDVYQVVVCDRDGFVNFTPSMSRCFLGRLQRDAKETAALLQQDSIEAFESVFLARHLLSEEYDLFFRISVQREQLLGKENLDASLVVHSSPSFGDRLAEILTRGLGDRAHSVYVWNDGLDLNWDAKKLQKQRVYIGVSTDASKAARIVDLGPPADETEKVVEFKAFWGSKAEIRRFADGSIVQAMVWDQIPTHARGHAVPIAVVEHLVALHGDVDPATIIRWDITSLYKALPALTSARHHDTRIDIFDKYEKLCKAMKELDGLPLYIRSVAPISSVLRHTDLLPPFPNVWALTDPSLAVDQDRYHDSAYVESIQSILTFESTSSWPDNIVAIAQVKTALLVRVSEELHRIGIRANAGKECVDAFYAGYVFRFYIHVKQHVMMLLDNRHQRAKGKELRRREIEMPLLATSLKSLHLADPSFGPVVRVAKRWVSAHMLGLHFPEEMVETLVAKMYYVYNPKSVLTGTVQFLRFIATLDFAQPIVLDCSDGGASAELKQNIDRDYHRRQAAVGLYVIMTKDSFFRVRSGEYSNSELAKPQVKRIQLLALHAVELLDSTFERWMGASTSGVAHHEVNGLWEKLFQPATSDCDAIVTLHRTVLPRLARETGMVPAMSGKKKNLKKVPKNLSSTAAARNRNTRRDVFPQLTPLSSADLLIDFNPVYMYLRLLEERFGAKAVFLFGYGLSQEVGVLWKPSAFLPKGFSVKACVATLPLEDECVTIVPNICEILGDVKRAGEGLVERVQLL